MPTQPMYHVLLAADETGSRTQAQLKTIDQLLNSGTDLRVTLLHVFASEGNNRFDEDETRLAEPPSNVTRLEQELEQRNVPINLKLKTSNNVGTTIVNTADELAVDSILIGGRKRSPIGKAFFGSVGQHTILNSEIPVVIAK